MSKNFKSTFILIFIILFTVNCNSTLENMNSSKSDSEIEVLSSHYGLDENENSVSFSGYSNRVIPDAKGSWHRDGWDWKYKCDGDHGVLETEIHVQKDMLNIIDISVDLTPYNSNYYYYYYGYFPLSYRFKLESPNGISVWLNYPDYADNNRVNSNEHLVFNRDTENFDASSLNDFNPEFSKGNWKLTVVDEVCNNNSDLGVLSKWELKFESNNGPRTCEDILCEEGQHCEMEVWPCYMPPCMEVPVCVDNEVCDTEHPELCTTERDCLGAELNWCDDTCQIEECVDEVEACLEECGLGCPHPAYMICGSDGESYCNECVLECYGLTRVSDSECHTCGEFDGMRMELCVDQVMCEDAGYSFCDGVCQKEECTVVDECGGCEDGYSCKSIKSSDSYCANSYCVEYKCIADNISLLGESCRYQNCYDGLICRYNQDEQDYLCREPIAEGERCYYRGDCEEGSQCNYSYYYRYYVCSSSSW